MRSLVSMKFAGVALLATLWSAQAFAGGGAVDWKPANGPLMTRWAKEVSPTNALTEYPRPQVVRKEWLNLNGLWDYAIRPRDEIQPENYDGKILVPFPVESALSGVMKKVGATNRLWYRRTFTVPETWAGKRVLLNFGAVDWQATVSVNGKELGAHKGGYGEFKFDITDALKPAGDQELLVSVWDPTDSGSQPRGKQVGKPGGIWYTSVSGIWQTVWLEPVPKSYIELFNTVADLDHEVVTAITTIRASPARAMLEITVLSGGKEVVTTNLTVSGRDEIGTMTRITPLVVPEPKTWSPDSPFLYDLRVTLKSSKGDLIDSVTSYFAFRTITVEKDEQGTPRICLNHKPLFEFGPLDQGWWPDGLYTAPTDEALRYDIEMTKKLGFNLIRKHVKVEPERWYYWCDKLGMLVWQDMPSGFVTGRGANTKPNAEEEAQTAREYGAELKELLDGRKSHPCIVMWVPFNEGWGQHDTEEVVDWMKKYDTTRLVNNASGWTDHDAGDVRDIHVYPGPRAPEIEPERAGVLGEFGGLGLPIAGHTWQSQANWGYRSFSNQTELTDAYVSLMNKLHPLVGGPGLSAAVYTQTTDVEVEVNGLMTYDRAILKMDEARVKTANAKLFTPPPPAPVVQLILPSSRERGEEWSFTTNKPAGDEWVRNDFDDSKWTKGPGGFGTTGTPRTSVRTTWNTADIWLRRTFELPDGFNAANPEFLIYHDEDAEIYLNGKLALKTTGYNGDYEILEMSKEAQRLLKAGVNTMAVHCHQTTGGQYIDVGLVNVLPPTK